MMLIFLSAPEGALAAVVVQAVARLKAQDAIPRADAAVRPADAAAAAVGLPADVAPAAASCESPAERGGAAVGRAADLRRGAAAPPGAELRLGPEVGLPEVGFGLPEV